MEGNTGVSVKTEGNQLLCISQNSFLAFNGCDERVDNHFTNATLFLMKCPCLFMTEHAHWSSRLKLFTVLIEVEVLCGERECSGRF